MRQILHDGSLPSIMLKRRIQRLKPEFLQTYWQHGVSLNTLHGAPINTKIQFLQFGRHLTQQGTKAFLDMSPNPGDIETETMKQA